MISIDKREAELTLKTQKSELMNSIASLMADIKVDFLNHLISGIVI